MFEENQKRFPLEDRVCRDLNTGYHDYLPNDPKGLKSPYEGTKEAILAKIRHRLGQVKIGE